MGAVAERMSDIAVVTSDNPRSENELSVIEDILSGMSREYRVRSCVVIPDRALAIEAAVGMARRGDGIVIGGKGAETYIERFGVRTHFDDREEARKAVKAAQERSA
jgi:UDP-N-acetylmuramoyl-L-alanyl-D-glutamate--2,6-diaminopimelate ligase